MSTSPQIRPLSASDLFDTAFQIYRRSFWRLIALTAIVGVPLLIAQIFVLRQTTYLSFDVFGMSYNFLGWFVINGIASVVFESVMNGALIACIASAYLKGSGTSAEAYRLAFRRYPSLALTALATFAVKSLTRPIGSLFDLAWYSTRFFFVGWLAPHQQSDFEWVPLLLFCLAILLAFQILALLLYSYVMLAPQAVMLEGCGPWAGLRRSWQLVRGSARRALGIVIAAEILRLLFSWSQQLLIGLAFNSGIGIDAQLFSVLIWPFGLAIYLLVQPILIAVFTVFYYDLRVRKEGFDMELRAQQANTPAPALP